MFGQTKSPHRFPVVGDVARILDEQRRYVDLVERATDRIVPHVFCFPDGRQIKYPDDAFKAAAKAIGYPDFRIHDLRRFAASRMAEMGIPEVDAMELLGMETRSIFDRYNITNARRKVAVVEKLAGALDAKPTRKVVGLAQSGRKDGKATA